MPNLQLTLAEIMAIEDTLSLDYVSDGTMMYTGFIEDGPNWRELCLKVGSAVCEAARAQNDIAIAFDADELWLLREALDIFATSGSDQTFGLTLKCKVYAGLLSLANTVGELEMPAGDPADPMYDLSRLSEIEDLWKDSSNADSHST